MIGFLILTIICISWFTIAQIQSAKKEALRRESVERLAGMMDAFTENSIWNTALVKSGRKPIGVSWWFNEEKFQFETCDINLVSKMFESDKVWNSDSEMWEDELLSPIGYRLHILQLKDLPKEYPSEKASYYSGWSTSAYVLIGELYDNNGNRNDPDVGKPFCTFKMFLGL